jgi:hypothetical protein
MAVSRDAVNWKICSDHGFGYYVGRGMEVGGKKINGASIANGIIRRGDKLWQYANCAVSGEQTYRVEQRLDGFMSLDAGEEQGVIVTRPFIFEGNKLVLNAAVKGALKAGILNLAGRSMTGYNVALTDAPKKPVPGYRIADCDAIRGDSVRHIVRWKGSDFVGNLAGQVVRLRIEMNDARLFAFQFEK